MLEVTSENEVAALKALLKRLASKIDEFIPNVRGASLETIEDAHTLIIEAFTTASRLEHSYSSKGDSTSYTKAELIEKAVVFANIVDDLGDPGDKGSFYRDLGLLTSFICESL